jgi:hypothetical protein
MAIYIIIAWQMGYTKSVYSISEQRIYYIPFEDVLITKDRFLHVNLISLRSTLQLNTAQQTGNSF